MKAAALRQNMEIKVKKLWIINIETENWSTTKCRKYRLNLIVVLIKEISTAMQSKRMLCECYARLFFMIKKKSSFLKKFKIYIVLLSKLQIPAFPTSVIVIT